VSLTSRTLVAFVYTGLDTCESSGADDRWSWHERCKKWVLRVHNIQECDATIPTLLRVPPSKINWKESLEEGDDHLSCVGRSLDVCCLGAVSRWHIILVVCDGFECKLRSRSITNLKLCCDFASTSSVRTTVTWSDRNLQFRDRYLHPSVTVFWRTDTKTLPLCLCMYWQYDMS
jgi:hypothetical protein